MMFITPSGTPASEQISANKRAVKEVYSAGLRTTVLPAAKAGAIFRQHQQWEVPRYYLATYPYWLHMLDFALIYL